MLGTPADSGSVIGHIDHLKSATSPAPSAAWGLVSNVAPSRHSLPTFAPSRGTSLLLAPV
ncbi:hypothetical protein BaRGS_00000749, partial [Batillaria attramentaria]